MVHVVDIRTLYRPPNSFNNKQEAFRECKHLHVCDLWHVILTLWQGQEHLGYLTHFLPKLLQKKLLWYGQEIYPMVRQFHDLVSIYNILIICKIFQCVNERMFNGYVVTFICTRYPYPWSRLDFSLFFF